MLAAAQQVAPNWTYVLPFIGTLITAGIAFLAWQSRTGADQAKLAIQKSDQERQDREAAEEKARREAAEEEARRQEQATRMQAAIAVACSECEEKVRNLMKEMSLMTDRLYAAHEEIGVQRTEKEQALRDLRRCREQRERGTST